MSLLLQGRACVPDDAGGATDAQANAALDFGMSYNAWQYAGIICNLLIGIRVSGGAPYLDGGHCG